MALWGSKKADESASEVSSNATPITAETVAQIVATTLQSMGIATPQPAPVAQSQINPEDDTDTAKIARLENRLATMESGITPYAMAFDTSVPQVVREQVVGTLDEGEKIIYNKYRHEVDQYMRNTSVQAKSDPATHRKAISLVLGEHVREVAALTLERATNEDVPHLAIPNTMAPPVASEPQLTPLEKQYVDGYAAYSRPGQGTEWNPTSWDYYKNIPRGYLHDMVAQHRANRTKKEEK